jgi:adhesin transport system membrane fusion protein
VEAQARSLEAQITRLEIEEVGDFNSPYVCPESVRKTAPSICQNEQNLLAVRREAYNNNVDVLNQRLIQREKELDEALANVKRLQGALAISKRQLDLITPMVKDKLVAETDLIKAQRDVNDYSGQLDSVTESIDRLKGAVNEAQLQVKDVLLKYEQDALSQKTDALAKLSVLREQARGESTKVARTDIRSPVEGVINTMEINTLGAFVQPGSPIAEIVPTSEELLVEARISPRDVAFVYPGQEALVKITAFDFSIYGGLEGEVVNVSSDSIVDQKTGEPYFEVRVKTRNAQLERAGNYFKITPGMVCTVDIKTGRKSILHYLLKPINKARQEALTER